MGLKIKFNCPVISEYAVASSLNYHMQTIHAEEHPNICEICAQAYALPVQLKAHLKSAHGDKTKGQCPVCKRYFVEIRRHIREGCGPKPLVPCDECGKKVKDLQKHKWQLHSGKSFACEVCGKLFSIKSTLRAHMDIHLGRRYSCYFCQHEATSSANRVKHMWQKHAAAYEQHRAEKEQSRMRNDDESAREESK